MKKELPSNLNEPIMDETNLVYRLYKFFCKIDFNGCAMGRIYSIYY